MTRQTPAFTLIELMVVVGIMGIILAAGAPSIYRVLQKEGMRKAASDVEEVCQKARARAILSGQAADVIFHPLEGRLEVQGGGSTGGDGESAPSIPAGTGASAQLEDTIAIEMLDINLAEYKDSEWARVRFYPNGTSDEMTLILRSAKDEWKKITTEVTTGLISVDAVR